MKGYESFSAEELRHIADAVEGMQTVLTALRNMEAWPRDWLVHIDSEIEPGYLGYIGVGEDGETAHFYPASDTHTKAPTQED